MICDGEFIQCLADRNWSDNFILVCPNRLHLNLRAVVIVTSNISTKNWVPQKLIELWSRDFILTLGSAKTEVVCSSENGLEVVIIVSFDLKLQHFWILSAHTLNTMMRDWNWIRYDLFIFLLFSTHYFQNKRSKNERKTCIVSMRIVWFAHFPISLYSPFLECPPIQTLLNNSKRNLSSSFPKPGEFLVNVCMNRESKKAEKMRNFFILTLLITLDVFKFLLPEKFSQAQNVKSKPTFTPIYIPIIHAF